MTPLMKKIQGLQAPYGATSKVHQKVWSSLCKLKEKEGLGLSQDRDINDSFMMKVAWDLYNKPGCQWVQVDRSKYGYGERVMPKMEKKRTWSNLWNGVKHVWECFLLNCEMMGAGDMRWKNSIDGVFTR